MGGLTGILIIIIVLLLVSGFRKLPDVGTGLGQTIRNFRRSLNEPDEIDVTPRANSGKQNHDKKDGDKMDSDKKDGEEPKD